MSSSDKMREQFESAVRAKWPGVRMLRVNRPGSPVDGEYELPGLEGAWWGWQASRRAIEVDLPCTYCFEGHDYFDERSVRDLIEAAGIRVAP